MNEYVLVVEPTPPVSWLGKFYYPSKTAITANRFVTNEDGTLLIYKNEQLVGVFAPGRWAKAVRLDAENIPAALAKVK